MNKKWFIFATLLLVFSFLAENAFSQASGTNPQLYMYRHNGVLGNTPSPAEVNDNIGTLEWRALTALNAIRLGATIKSTVKAVSPGFLMANMVFSTSGAAGISERAVITENGLFGIGTMNPIYHLDVVGNTHTSGRFFGRIHFDLGEPTDKPNTYNDEAYFERKTRAQLGLGANTYANGGILTLAPGGGSLDRQIFSGGDDGIWTRAQDAAGTDWEAWEKILTGSDMKGRANLVARFLPPGPVSNKIGDGQVFDNGANVVIGGIPAAPAVPSPSFNASDVLTVKGNQFTDGNTAINGALNVTNATTLSSTLTVSNATTLNNNLSVAGESSFAGKVKINAASFPSDNSYKLAVGGGIMAEEVLVQLQPWPDYVFADQYSLKPLNEVEQYISQEKHLPGVSSAKEVAENGLNLGEMQKMQMEKIEELYLYMIFLQKQVQDQQQTIQRLETALNNAKN